MLCAAKGSGSSSRDARDQLALSQERGPGRRAASRFESETYRERNVVERAFNRHKDWRGVATRYDMHARNYRAGAVIATIMMFWRRWSGGQALVAVALRQAVRVAYAIHGRSRS